MTGKLRINVLGVISGRVKGPSLPADGVLRRAPDHVRMQVRQMPKSEKFVVHIFVGDKHVAQASNLDSRKRAREIGIELVDKYKLLTALERAGG